MKPAPPLSSEALKSNDASTTHQTRPKITAVQPVPATKSSQTLQVSVSLQCSPPLQLRYTFAHAHARGTLGAAKVWQTLQSKHRTLSNAVTSHYIAEKGQNVRPQRAMAAIRTQFDWGECANRLEAQVAKLLVDYARGLQYGWQRSQCGHTYTSSYGIDSNCYYGQQKFAQLTRLPKPWAHTLSACLRLAATGLLELCVLNKPRCRISE